jgi:TolC family type I secretion outer membrane protein
MSDVRRRAARLAACLLSVVVGASAMAQQTTGAPVRRLDLSAALAKALANDPAFAAVRAETAAAQEEVPKARAGLLPSVALTGTATRNDLEVTSPNILGVNQTRNLNYPSETYALQLRQPLLRYGNWAQYRIAQAQADSAVAQQRNERQQLAVKIAESYFGILLGLEQARLTLAERAAYEATLNQAERAFQGGVATLTDTADARARRDQAAARVIEARNALAKVRRQLEVRIGEPVSQVAELDPGALTLAAPTPASPDEWVTRAWAASAEIETAQKSVDAARADVVRQKSQHAPTIDLIATAQKANNESTTSVNQRTSSSFVGVQVSIPIYAGGAIVASVRQALARQERAEQLLEALKRDVESRVREQYDAVVLGIDSVAAYEQSLRSAQESYRGTQKGLQAGTRTTVDLLNAESQVFGARQTLAQARLLYVLATLRLKAAAGVLDDGDIEAVNRSLTATAAVDVPR